MLVLVRKENESIKIGDDITIVIGRFKGDRITVCIDAPKDVKILRGELENTSKKEAKPSRVGKGFNKPVTQKKGT